MYLPGVFVKSCFLSGGFSCDFEQNFCSWKQDRTDNFDWHRNRRTTSSSGTGPSRDHAGQSELCPLPSFIASFVGQTFFTVGL